MFEVITIGAAVRDIFLVSKEFQTLRSPQFSSGVGECVSLGSKIDVDDMHYATGGGATNAAATFARLGFKTAIVARLGNDDAGKAVIADLEAFSVNTSLLKVLPKENTGYSTLLTAKHGERSILVYRGASGNFTATDIPLKNLTCKWLYITSLSGNLEVLKKVLIHAKKHNLSVALNPGRAELRRALELRPLYSPNLVPQSLLPMVRKGPTPTPTTVPYMCAPPLPSPSRKPERAMLLDLPQ